jgi:putative transposase
MRCQVAEALSNLGYSERVASRVAGVSRSCFYEHKFHVPSDRQIRRLLLMGLVADIHARSRGTYGMLRIRAALQREQNMIVNKKLILSIMRELGIKGLPGPKKRKKNLVNQATEEDLVKRNFTVDRPNVLWLTDITEHPTREGKVYCCVVLDAFSRRVVGWAIDRRCETALVNDALSMASESRAISRTSVIHSDHGSQLEFNRLSQHRLVWPTIGDRSVPQLVSSNQVSCAAGS